MFSVTQPTPPPKPHKTTFTKPSFSSFSLASRSSSNAHLPSSTNARARNSDASELDDASSAHLPRPSWPILTGDALLAPPREIRKAKSNRGLRVLGALVGRSKSKVRPGSAQTADDGGGGGGAPPPLPSSPADGSFSTHFQNQPPSPPPPLVDRIRGRKKSHTLSAGGANGSGSGSSSSRRGTAASPAVIGSVLSDPHHQRVLPVYSPETDISMLGAVGIHDLSQMSMTGIVAEPSARSSVYSSEIASASDHHYHPHHGHHHHHHHHHPHYAHYGSPPGSADGPALFSDPFAAARRGGGGGGGSSISGSSGSGGAGGAGMGSGTGRRGPTALQWDMHKISPKSQLAHLVGGSIGGGGPQDPGWTAPESWVVDNPGEDGAVNYSSSDEDRPSGSGTAAGGGVGGITGGGPSRSTLVGSGSSVATGSQQRKKNRRRTTLLLDPHQPHAHGSGGHGPSGSSVAGGGMGRRNSTWKEYRLRIYRANNVYHIVTITLGVTVASLIPVLNEKLLVDSEREPYRLYLRERGRGRFPSLLVCVGYLDFFFFLF
jgi:hypothetical protein